MFSDRRILELDGLRGVAALMVVVWHLTGGMVAPSWGLSATILRTTTIFGRTGVDLFFVLSGFLIIGLLVDHRDDPKLFRTFYIRRACRILPPYLVLVAAYWLAVAVLGQSAAFNSRPSLLVQIVAQITFTWNWLMAYFDRAISRGFSITWSVDIEEWFYLIFPFLIWITARSALVRLLGVIAVLSWLARGSYFLLYPKIDLAAYILTPFRLDALCIGGLVALAVRDQRVIAKAAERRTMLWRLAVAMIGAIPFIVALIQHDLNRHMYLWGHAYLAVAFALLIFLLATGEDHGRMLRTKFFRLAGRYSYSLYLFHPFFLSLFFVIADRKEAFNEPLDILLTIGSLLTTVTVCVLLSRFVEQPIQAYGRAKGRWQGSSSRMPSDAAGVEVGQVGRAVG